MKLPAPLALVTSFFCVSLVACTTQSRPNFYPNAHLKQVGQAQADTDLEDCRGLADQYVEDRSQYQEMAKDAAVAGTAGAAAGAVSGAILGKNVGRYTGAGAAAGAVVSVVRDLFRLGESDPSHNRFVEYCLQKRGYEIVSWSR